MSTPSPQKPSPQKPSPQKPSPQKPSPQKPLPPRTLQDIGINEADHPAWLNAFQPEARSQQLHEDHSAWAGVTGLLLTIIVMGVSLAVFAVTMSFSR